MKRLPISSLLALVASVLAVVAGAAPASADHGASTTTVGVNPPTSTYGQEIVEIFASVEDDSASCNNFDDCDNPTGIVQFFVDGVSIGTATDSPGVSGVSYFVLRQYCCLPAGTHTITAQYIPGPPNHFSPSSGQRSGVVVNKAAPVVMVDQSSPTSAVGQPVTFTAYVFGAQDLDAARPTGTVQFSVDGTPVGGPVPLTGAAADNSSTASLTTSSSSPGAHTISAQYSGDANYLAAAGNTTHTVQASATTVSLTSDNNPSTVGEPVTFSAIVTESGSGTPTGTITFKDGATTLATATLSGGVATYTTAALGVGNHSITAVYSGDANFAPRTSPVLTQTVLAHRTTTGLTSNPNPSVRGHPVTFQAVVTTPGPGTPTGTVRFMVGTGDTATILGTATLSGGVATFTTAALGVGAHTITAVYEGDATHGPSESALTQTVAACTVTALSSGGNTLGTAGNDVICGSPGADDIAGGGGDDLIVGGGGNDRISGGDGNDTISGGDGNDQLSGGAGNDTLNGDADTDAVVGGDGTDTCSAEAKASCET